MKRITVKKIKTVIVDGKRKKVLCYDYKSKNTGKTYVDGMISLDLTVMKPCFSGFDPIWCKISFQNERYFMLDGDNEVPIVRELIEQVVAVAMERTWAL